VRSSNPQRWSLAVVAAPVVAVLVVAVAAVVTIAGAGLVTQPSHLLGSPGGELWGHAWVQWWHGQALPAWPGGTDLALGTSVWPVIDPLTTLLMAGLGRLVGVVAAYNTGLLLAVALAFLGGAWLARHEGGQPLVGGLALALAPCFMGSLASGLTEDAALGLAAVALGLVGGRGWRSGLGLGLCLGLLAASGLVLAWATAVAAVLLALWAAWKRPASLRASALGAVVAAAIAAPLAWTQGGRLEGAAHHLGTAPQQVEPLWRLNPVRGVDLLSLVAPIPQAAGDALVRTHPGYLGLSLLALALLGWRGDQAGALGPQLSPQRSSRRWWLLLVLVVLVAPGDTLSFGGQPLHLANPAAAALDWLPGGTLINHHGRLLLVAAVALSVLAARGAAVLERRFGKPAVVAALALVAGDLVVLAPGGAPLPTADASPAAITTKLAGLSPGRVLVLPVAGPGVHPQRPLLDQRAHGRPLLLDPKRPGLPPALASSEAGRWLGGLAFPRPPAPPLDGGEVLAALGPVEVLVVMQPLVGTVQAVLGPPAVTAPDGAAWDVAAMDRTSLSAPSR